MSSSLPSLQKAANERYYSSKGRLIYSDFSTFAQGKALAACNAIEFCRRFSSQEGGISVCEYGVGNGNFARVFLDEVKRRDAKLCGRISYHLFDFSGKMLSSAKETLKPHLKLCAFRQFDAALDTPSLQFDYCRINELLSDLPAELYVREGNAIFTQEGRQVSVPSPLVSKFLERVDEGRRIPFCFAAEKFLLSLCGCGKSNAAIDIFDYGFYAADDVFLLPVGEWNRLVAREFGGQVTVDLNFTQLSAALSFVSIQHSIEPQKAYCERVLGKKLRIEQAESGLDYVPAKHGRISEDDGFLHLRVGL